MGSAILHSCIWDQNFAGKIIRIYLSKFIFVPSQPLQSKSITIRHQSVIDDLSSHLPKNAINLSLGQEHQAALSEWWGGPGLYNNCTVYISLDILTAWADPGSCSPSVYVQIFQEHIHHHLAVSNRWGVIAILNHSVPPLHHFDNISNKCLASQMCVIMV